LDILTTKLRLSTPGDDPLGLAIQSKITRGFNPRRVNIGTATRKLYFNTFKEYFRDEGSKDMNECWLAAAE
jgi:hypothetical protein